MELITPGGSPDSDLENPPSKEAGLKDSGGGQPLLCKNTMENILLSNLVSNKLFVVSSIPKNTLFLLNRPRSSSCNGTLPMHKDGKESNSNSIIGSKDGAKSSEEKWKDASKRKRLCNSPETQTRNQKQTKLNTYWLSAPVQTSNRFAALEKEDQQTELISPGEKTPKPSPIYVDRVSNIQPLTGLLNDSVEGEYEIKILKDEEVKILFKTTQAYSTIIKKLQKKGTEFHTHKLKQDRSFRVVLKNIHPSTDVSELKKAIEDLGHQVNNIWSIKGRLTKNPFYCVSLILNLIPTTSKFTA